MFNRQTCICALALICCQLAWPQTGLINTYAGNGNGLYSGDGGAATSAAIYHPFGLALDASGNLYISDSGNARIRRVDVSSGIITTVAGSGITGYGGDGGPATAAQLSNPTDVKLDGGGNLYVCDSNNNRIRRVDGVTGIISTIAGTGVGGFGGDGGAAIGGALSGPSGLAIDSAGNIYIADVLNYRIRRVDASTGIITTVAGNGVAAFSGDGGPATAASLSSPVALALDSAGNAYVSDANILYAASGGSGSGGGPPAGNYRIRRIDAATGIISTVAGTGTSSFNGDGIPATSASLGFPVQLVFDSSGNLIFADAVNYRVRTVDASTGLIWTIAGSGSPPAPCCPIGDGGPATNAGLSLPVGLAISPSGSLFASEEGGNRVRRVALPSPFASTAVTLSSSSSSVPSGNPVTLTAVLSAINGLAGNSTRGFQFVDTTSSTSTYLGHALVVNGSGSLTTSLSGTGTHNIVATYVGDSAFGGSSSPALSVNVTAPQSSVTLSSNTNPSVDGQPFTLTATVAPASATGTVTFFNGTFPIATQSLNNGIATSPQIFLMSGTYSMSAQYGGDNNHPAATSATITQIVKAISSVTLTSSANPATAGQAFTLTATVSPSTATGTVQFLNSGMPIGSASIVSGGATLTATFSSPGTQSLSASYGGDSNTVGSTSATISQVIKETPSLTLTASANPSTLGQAVTFTLAVTPSTATGTVQFLDGGTVIGTSTVGSGTATFSTSALTQGLHSITASYGGDPSFFAATSAAISQSVKSIPSLTLVSSANPTTSGQAVTFTVTVMPSTATGSVQFLDGGVVLGTTTVGSGSAVFSTSALTQGTHSITAAYGGDSSFAAANSAAVSQSVKNVTSLALASSVNPSTIGQAVTFTVNLDPTATGSVQFLDGAATIGSGSVASGVATYSTSGLSVGTHTITTTYGGDTNFSSASSPPLTQTVALATATVSLASTQNPSPVGQPVTFIATVSPSSATGNVQFLDGATVIGTGTITSGSAQFSTAALTQGTHSITAAYSGDSTLAAATSPAVSQAVKLNAGLSFTAGPNPSTVGQTVTFTVNVNPAATGSVQYFDGAALIGTASVVSGVATFSTPALAQGTHPISVVYSGDANYLGAGSAALNQTVNAKQTSTVSLASTQNPSPVGQPVTFIATVTPSTATGSVQFLDGAAVIGTVTITSGSAQFSTSVLTQGTHSITAGYGGDSTFLAANSPAVSQAVKLNAGLSFTASPNPSTVGQTVTFTVNVNPAATGSVQYFDGSALIGTASVVSGVATFSTSALAQGTHSISVVYSGDANYLGAGSAALNQTVNAKQTPNVALASSANPATAGQSLTFTASITPTTATGSVQFLDGSTVIGTASVASGVATFSTSALARGTHSISAVYGGDSFFVGAASAAIAQSVKGIAGLTLASSANPSTAGQTVTFTATANPAATGSVQYFDGAALIGTASVASGVATFSTSALTAANHSISVVYSGDANFFSASSAPLTQTVVKASSSVALASSLNPSTAGQSVVFTATVSPASATGTVQFFDGQSSLGTVTVTNGSGSLTTSALVAGSHSIKVVYSGDAATLGSTSSVLTQTVKIASTTTLTSSLNPANHTNTITFSAKVTPSAVTGSVQFFDGTTLLGTTTLSSGKATLSKKLSSGTHQIQAVYGGDVNNGGSSSAILTETVH